MTSPGGVGAARGDAPTSQDAATTSVDLDALDALAAAATSAPWVVANRRHSACNWIAGGPQGYDDVIAPENVDCMSHCYGGSSRIELSDTDAAFIAAARDAVPALIAEVRRLRAAAASPVPVAADDEVTS